MKQDRLAIRVLKANRAAMDRPAQPDLKENPAPQARTAHQDQPEKMEPKEARDRTDRLARQDRPDRKEKKDPTELLARMANPAHPDQPESQDRPERLDHLDLPARRVLVDRPASTPSTAHARVAHSSARSRRTKQHPTLSIPSLLSTSLNQLINHSMFCFLFLLPTVLDNSNSAIASFTN